VPWGWLAYELCFFNELTSFIWLASFFFFCSNIKHGLIKRVRSWSWLRDKNFICQNFFSRCDSWTLEKSASVQQCFLPVINRFISLGTWQERFSLDMLINKMGNLVFANFGRLDFGCYKVCTGQRIVRNPESLIAISLSEIRPHNVLNRNRVSVNEVYWFVHSSLGQLVTLWVWGISSCTHSSQSYVLRELDHCFVCPTIQSTYLSDSLWAGTRL
jgi:hypothetical protein